MNVKRMRAAAVVVLLGLGLAGSALAEVSINGHGETIYFHAHPGQVWSLHRQGVPSHAVLNPFGDARGDGLPSMARNPATGAWEVAWGRSGMAPALMFASWDEDADAWKVRTVASAPSASRWAARVVELTHDDFGNRFVIFSDPETGLVLLASAPRDSDPINRPIAVNVPGVGGSCPTLFWDGEFLVIAYARWEGGLDVLHLLPDVDDDGRIPNAGIGIPGIPDLQLSYEPPSRVGPLSAMGAPVVPIPGPLPTPGDDDATPKDDLPALVRIELLDGDQLLITWIEDEETLAYTVRSAGNWSHVATHPLDDPVRHEEARGEVRRLLGAAVAYGSGGRTPRSRR